MADGRRRDAWSHTSHLLAITYNMHRSQKAPSREPREFNPMATDGGEQSVTPAPITALKALL